MDAAQLVEYGLRRALALGASEAEVYVVRNLSTGLRGTVKGLERASSGEVVLVGVRVAVGKRVTVQGGMVSSAADIDRIVDDAVRVARVVPEDPKWVSLPTRLEASPAEVEVDEFAKNLDPAKMSEMVRYLLEAPREIDRRVYTAEAGVEVELVERAIGNSYTSKILSEVFTYASAGVEVKAVEGGEESGAYDWRVAPKLSYIDLEKLVREASELAVRGLRARVPETGSYDLLLAPRVFSRILGSLIAPAVSADNVQRGRSPLAGKIGTQVLSPALTIVDDGLARGLTGTRGFDDEGVATSRKHVFERGVLRTYLYDNYTAKIEGRESTGNARRTSPAAQPAPSITNFVVEAGQQSVDSLIREVKRGILVFETIGEWLSNPVTGLLNATVTHGLLIEGGEIKGAVCGAVVGGNIYDLLSAKLVALSREVEDRGNFRVPYVLISGASVAGK